MECCLVFRLDFDFRKKLALNWYVRNSNFVYISTFKYSAVLKILRKSFIVLKTYKLNKTAFLGFLQ